MLNENAKSEGKGGSSMRRIDGKFSMDGTRIFNTVSGVDIPEFEPLFILRARDHHALEAINAYHQICGVDCNDLHLAAVEQAITRFEQFRDEHLELMKQPGITRHIRLDDSGPQMDPSKEKNNDKIK